MVGGETAVTSVPYRFVDPIALSGNMGKITMKQFLELFHSDWLRGGFDFWEPLLEQMRELTRRGIPQFSRIVCLVISGLAYPWS